MMDRYRMPAAFIGHGSPMNTLEVNDFSLSMTSYVLGMQPPAARLHGDSAQSMPTGVLPEQTNT